jgi:non-ribosomal peptide synthetase component E (peptide arylation enzyme)
MKPIRQSELEIEKYVKEGHWDTKNILPDYWEQNAQKWPDREALVDSRGVKLTWKEGVQRINRIALALIHEVKLDRDDRLMVQLPNTVDQVLFRLACEKAGVLSIPEMYTFREREIQWIGSQTQAVGIVIQKNFRKFDYYEMVKELQAELPHLKHIIVSGKEVPQGCFSLEEIMQYPYEQKYDLRELETTRLDPINDVGFLVTTTGTTGMPKIIEHRIAAREIWTAKSHIRNWKLSPEDTIVALAPISGAAGGTPAYLTAPIAGAKAALDYEGRGDESTLEFIEQERATVIALVPTQLARLVQLPLEKFNLSSLRFIKTAGGYLPPALAREAEEKFKRPILGTFGSQDQGAVSGVPISAPREARYTTVGRVHPGIELRIVDDDGKEVTTPGEVGQIWFRGPGNAIGYYRDIEKTLAEAFDKDGWATTGDLVTLTEDGYLKIVGRKKDIIIRGGQNIYPKEIEDLLIAHPKVIESALVAMPDPQMGEKACAFVTLKPGETFTFEEMTDYLKNQKIAMFKIPERLEVIAAMPLAGGSKIDKKELTRMIIAKLREEGKID